jgi:hypothetical protein
MYFPRYNQSIPYLPLDEKEVRIACRLKHEHAIVKTELN